MFKNRRIIPPTFEEDEAINRGIAADPDTYKPSASEIAQMKPFNETRNRGCQPKSENPKEQVGIFEL